ncbi:hypothetical protein [Massilia sp. AB1]|uniref:hypothetical protein n=1 Tax=Massilia sp. AB1 TaxID=2823371 RepID=UPI001B82467B|nr:hypothetical protein [Massilia sp. AB1]MBQ5942227.1 hypothetical protein [Massilia sp. AB1]
MSIWKPESVSVPFELSSFAADATLLRLAVRTLLEEREAVLVGEVVVAFIWLCAEKLW